MLDTPISAKYKRTHSVSSTYAESRFASRRDLRSPMAKGKPHSKPSKSRGESPTQLRAKIDRLDRELMKLVNERAELATRHDSAGEGQNGLTQDEKSLDQLVESSKGPLTPRCVRAIFRELYSG